MIDDNYSHGQMGAVLTAPISHVLNCIFQTRSVNFC